MSQSPDSSIPIRIWSDSLPVLDRLMEHDDRRPTSRQQMLHWLISEAAHRRGLDPETLQPVSSPEPGPTASQSQVD